MVEVSHTEPAAAVAVLLARLLSVLAGPVVDGRLGGAAMRHVGTHGLQAALLQAADLLVDRGGSIAQGHLHRGVAELTGSR